ncbi:helix-turn-helix domain-containing protein [Azospirillum brasilense]|uniref:helix-turn-helix domain-containing protein n=1 Tax=Azospirillum brasilense TaxID=192 RepID=UPI000E69A370|nr:helix-turn-helix transcriptional regulator [Azospirillum brasilense]NUB24311.1 helix-turn-helix domain-containing protein [Azospirillum brasilense]NUB34117.1 helix-turn-helix domain-containing protein [Azospirillum brasilense]RIW00994.1 XRE family transcriptional regulator [Azospirillum brasilense]
MFFFSFGNGASGIVAQQIRAARALLGISAEELARRASVGVATVRRAELAQDKPSITDANLIAIKRALEDAGVDFIDGDSAAGPGVRLKEPSPPQMPER